MPTKDNRPSLTVIIPTRNEEENVARAIASARASGATQIIVVDGHSQDRTTSIAQNAGAQVIPCQPGRGGQIAAGLAHALGEFVLFLHADSTVESDLGEQLRHIDRPIVWGCLSQVIAARGWLYRCIERGNHFRARRLGMPYGDQAIWARRAVLQQVGIPNIPIMEDVELAARLGTFHRPYVLPTITITSARRWHDDGPICRTLGNWSLLFRYRVLNHSPDQLARAYRSPIASDENRIKKGSDG